MTAKFLSSLKLDILTLGSMGIDSVEELQFLTFFPFIDNIKSHTVHSGYNLS